MTFENIDELNSVLRKVLIEQSELPADRVLNSLSEYGTDLDILLEDNSYDSINFDTPTMLFELSLRPSSSDISENSSQITQEKLTVSDYIYVDGLVVSDDGPIINDTIDFYKSYKLHVIIYGNNGYNIANKTIGRLRSEFVRNEVQEKGIYLESVENLNSLKESKFSTDSKYIPFS